MKSKKILALLACVSVLMPALCSCQFVYVTSSEESAAATSRLAVETRDISIPEDTEPEISGIKYSDLTTRWSDAEAAVKSLYAQDLTGYSFMCVVAEEADNTLLCEETDAMYYSCAKRNALVTDYYKNSFYVRTSSLAEIKTELAASIKAGTGTGYYADMLEVPALGAGALAVSGLLMNLRSLPFYTVNSDSFSLYGTKLYFDDSRACENVSSYYCLFFNRSLTGDAVASSLYSAALNGNFTFEALITAAKECYVGSEVATLGIDGNMSDLGELAFIRSGYKYTVASEKYPVLADTVANASKLDSLFEAILSLSSIRQNPEIAEGTVVSSTAVDVATVGSASIDVTINPSSPALQGRKTPFELFKEGSELFYIGTLDDIAALSEERITWGLLPLPAEASTALNVSKKRSVFCVCANNARLEMTGLMLTALDAVSTEWIGDEFLVNAAQNHLRDNDSYYTLSRILGRRSFVDFAWLYGSSVKDLDASTYLAVRSAVASGPSVSSSAIPLEESVNSAIKKLK